MEPDCLPIPPEVLEKAQLAMDGFEISNLMKEKLDNVAHTSEQLESIISEIVKTIVKL